MKKYVSSGNHISKVELSTCKAGGSQTEYCRITLEDVIVTNVLFNGAIHSEILSLSYQFQASKVEIQYWKQTFWERKGPSYNQYETLKVIKKINYLFHNHA